MKLQAWLNRRRSTLIGKYYKLSDYKQRDQFVDWFLGIVEEVEL